MRWLLLLMLLPSTAWACPTCGTSAMPGLGSATDLAGAYPGALDRVDAPRFALEGAGERQRSLQGALAPKVRLQTVAARANLLTRPTILAGFSVKSDGVGLHICGPELTLELTY